MDIENASQLMARAMPDIEDARLRLALLKENFEYRAFFREFKEWVGKNPDSRVWPGLGFTRIFHLTLYPGSPLYKDILKAVDPFEEHPPNIDHYLPNLFHDPGVTRIDPGSFSIVEGSHHRALWHFLKEGPKPWERLYAVDLRKPKAQIEAEFKVYLDWAFSEKADPNHDPCYDGWEAHNSRRRSEAWNHFEVWKLRKKRLSFSAIARRLETTIDAAKKSFARAYELTQNVRYDAVRYRREAWAIKMNEIARTCDVCPDRSTCAALCPDMLFFVDQDQTAQKEKLLDDADYVNSLAFDEIA